MSEINRRELMTGAVATAAAAALPAIDVIAAAPSIPPGWKFAPPIVRTEAGGRVVWRVGLLQLETNQRATWYGTTGE